MCHKINNACMDSISDSWGGGIAHEPHFVSFHPDLFSLMLMYLAALHCYALNQCHSELVVQCHYRCPNE